MDYTICKIYHFLNFIPFEKQNQPKIWVPNPTRVILTQSKLYLIRGNNSG